MRAVVAAVMLVVIVSIALARQQPPQPPHAPLEQMKALDWLVGHWTGEGEMSFGPGNTHAVRVDEHVQRKLGGTILLVEGIGREGAPGGPDERIVHQAHHDSLSGLPNRELAVSQLRTALEKHKRLAVVSVLWSISIVSTTASASHSRPITITE